MKILIVNTSKIPALLYGGTERVIWYLGKELVKLGHQVSYLVHQNSTCDFAKIIPIDPTKEIIDQIPNTFDFVHFNFTPNNLDKLKIPYLITVHGNTNSVYDFDKNSVFVSKNHAQRHGSESFVYNGLDWNDYTKPDFSRQRKYYHFLGNAAWRVKNVRGAIAVIKKTKAEKLKVLGGVRFNINMGIRFTFSPRITFEGMVGGSQKDNFLNQSKGLLFPVRWHEPFGLAITESLYFGCPIYGTPYGSLPEIVQSDFGFLSNNKQELTEALQLQNKYNNKDCHQYALEEFNSKKMALSYLDKYQQVLAGQELNNFSPRLLEVQETKFLDWN